MTIDLKFFPTAILTGSSLVSGMGADFKNCSTSPAWTLAINEAMFSLLISSLSNKYLSFLSPIYMTAGAFLVSTPKYSASLSNSPCPSLASERARRTLGEDSSSSVKAALAAVEASLLEVNKKRAGFFCWKIFSMALLSNGRTSELTTSRRAKMARSDRVKAISFQINLYVYRYIVIEIVGYKGLVRQYSIYQFDNNMGERFVIGSDEARYKIILVGDVNVGKTAMFWRYTQGQFLAYKDTQVTTIDFKMKAVTINNKLIKLYIWDTAGSQKYRSIVSTYFKGCHGVILVFDLSRENSFKNAIDTWYQLAKLKTNDSAFCLVGNKSDLDIRVDTEEVKKWSNEHNIPYIETSVKQNKNVNEVFDSVARKVYEKQNKIDRTKSFSLSQSKPTPKRKCC